MEAASWYSNVQYRTLVVCETIKIDESYTSEYFNSISNHMGCIAVVNTIIENKLSPHYYKGNSNSAALLYKQNQAICARYSDSTNGLYDERKRIIQKIVYTLR